MSGLTTHVLDTALGRPAAGLRLELVRLEAGGERHLAGAVTNDDGRCDGPLVDGQALTAGDYELRFDVGDYLSRHHPVQAERPFLDRVPIRFRVSEPGQHYHVPLLLSPYGYSTYRGS